MGNSHRRVTLLMGTTGCCMAPWPSFLSLLLSAHLSGPWLASRSWKKVVEDKDMWVQTEGNFRLIVAIGLLALCSLSCWCAPFGSYEFHLNSLPPVTTYEFKVQSFNHIQGDGPFSKVVATQTSPGRKCFFRRRLPSGFSLRLPASTLMWSVGLWLPPSRRSTSGSTDKSEGRGHRGESSFALPRHCNWPASPPEPSHSVSLCRRWPTLRCCPLWDSKGARYQLAGDGGRIRALILAASRRRTLDGPPPPACSCTMSPSSGTRRRAQMAGLTGTLCTAMWRGTMRTRRLSWTLILHALVSAARACGN